MGRVVITHEVGEPIEVGFHAGGHPARAGWLRRDERVPVGGVHVSEHVGVEVPIVAAGAVQGDAESPPPLRVRGRVAGAPQAVRVVREREGETLVRVRGEERDRVAGEPTQQRWGGHVDVGAPVTVTACLTGGAAGLGAGEARVQQRERGRLRDSGRCGFVQVQARGRLTASAGEAVVVTRRRRRQRRFEVDPDAGEGEQIVAGVVLARGAQPRPLPGLARPTMLAGAAQLTTGTQQRVRVRDHVSPQRRQHGHRRRRIERSDVAGPGSAQRQRHGDERVTRYRGIIATAVRAPLRRHVRQWAADRFGHDGHSVSLWGRWTHLFSCQREAWPRHCRRSSREDTPPGPGRRKAPHPPEGGAHSHAPVAARVSPGPASSTDSHFKWRGVRPGGRP